MIEINYGLIFGFTVGINYANFEESNEGEYLHVLQILLGFFMIELSWISYTYTK